jgi:hypothetical protein
MTLDVDTIYTIVVIVNTIYNFAVGIFFWKLSWQFFYLKTFRFLNIHFKILRFEIHFFWNFQTTSDGDTLVIKIIELNKI